MHCTCLALGSGKALRACSSWYEIFTKLFVSACCRWQASEQRQLQLLQRELLQQAQHPIDLLVAATAAAGAEAASPNPAAAAAAAAVVEQPAGQLQEEVEGFVGGLLAASQQLLLWQPQKST
jgi:hypothetical protein